MDAGHNPILFAISHRPQRLRVFPLQFHISYLSFLIQIFLIDYLANNAPLTFPWPQ